MSPKTRTLRVRGRRAQRVLRTCCAAAAAFAVCLGSMGRAQEGTEQPSSPENHSVAEGDTLWDLSNRYYGSSYEWPRLWSYNPEITNPHWIYPGHMLRLRPGAAGGYTTAPAEGVAAAGTVLKSGFGRGFGGARSNVPAGTVQLGEEVYLDKDALERAGQIVGSFEEHMMLTPSDEVYLKFDKGEVPALGKELSVFVRAHRGEVYHEAGKLKNYDNDNGEVVRVLGVLKVKSYDERKGIARAVITEALDGIERGFEVTDVPRRLAQVAPKTNKRNVKSEIVAATRPLGTLGQNQVIFIGAGTEQGVEVGNRFSVIRYGDSWRESLTLREELTGATRRVRNAPRGDDYPVEVVGEARVIYVRPESCTALITASVRELNPGDVVEMREGY